MNEPPIQMRASVYDVRQQAFDRLPKWKPFQALITFVYGVPHAGQRPFVKQTPTSIFVLSYVWLALSVIATCSLLALWPQASLFGKFLIVSGVLGCDSITTGYIRLCHHTLLHHASHRNFGGKSEILGEIASLSVLSLPLATFRKIHDTHHGGPAKEGDPDLDTIIDFFGFCAGQTQEWYWKHMRRLMLSARTMLRLLKLRWTTNFAPGQPRWRMVLAAAFTLAPPALAVTLALRQGSVLPCVMYLVAWFLPLVLGFYWAMILYMLGLHLWLKPDEAGKTPREALVERTGARFFGDPLPLPGLPWGEGVRQWSAWWMRFVFLHLLLSRIVVVSGDNSAHDIHHISPRKFDFANPAFARAEFIDSSKDTFWETWGLFPAIVRTFEVLGAVDPASVSKPSMEEPDITLRAIEM